MNVENIFGKFREKSLLWVEKTKSSLFENKVFLIVRKLFFKKKDVLIIELGEFNLKVVLFSFAGSQKKVKNIWIQKIIHLSAEEKENALLSLIKDNFSTETLKQLRVFFVLPERVLTTHRFTIPSIPASEINSALKFRLKDEISWDIEKTIYIWKIVRETKDAKGIKKLDLIVSLVLKDKVDNILKLSKRMGVSCYGIYSHFFSLANLSDFSDAQDAIAVVDIGGVDTSFMIVKNNLPLFLRRISFSSTRLTEAIMENSEKNDVSFDEIESVKKEQGLSEKLFSYMRSDLEKLIAEIKRSIEYYNSAFEETRIDKIYLLGGGSQLKELNNVLSRELKLEVTGFPLTKEIEIIKESGKENLSAYLPTILGAVKEKRVNFLPKELRVSKLEEMEGALLKIGISILSLVFLVLFLNTNFQLNNMKKRFKYAEAHLGAFGNIKELKDEIRVKDNLLDKLKKSYIPGEWIMKSISAYLPLQIVLEKMDLHLNQKLVSLGGQMPDTVDAEEILIEYANKLYSLEIFEDVNIINMVKTTSKKSGRVMVFQMNCKLIDTKWLR